MKKVINVQSQCGHNRPPPPTGLNRVKRAATVLVLIVKHTQSISSFDYIIILNGAMFTFADVTENGILCWIIQFTFCVSCPLAIIIQEIHGRMVLSREYRKHEWNNLFFWEETKRDMLIFHFDVITKRLLSVLKLAEMRLKGFWASQQGQYLIWYVNLTGYLLSFVVPYKSFNFVT